MRLTRMLRHIFTTRYGTRRHFPPAVRDAIEKAIGECEGRHGGEIRFVVETALDVPEVWRGLAPRQRALQMFGQFDVWDTAQNNGVLIYVLMADHDVEIVADRGIAAHVTAGRVAGGVPADGTPLSRGPLPGGLRRWGSWASVRCWGDTFRARARSDNELPNQPVLL